MANLLEADRIDVTVGPETGYQFHPEQTTSAIICHHPQAKYFIAAKPTGAAQRSIVGRGHGIGYCSKVLVVKPRPCADSMTVRRRSSSTGRPTDARTSIVSLTVESGA